MSQVAADVYEEALSLALPLVGRLVTVEQTGGRCSNEEATRDSIYHYACGVDDFNPLWLDAEYARRSRFGSLIAPPTFAYSIHLPSIGTYAVPFVGESNWALVYGGCSWRYYRPARLGDEFHVTAKLADVELKPSKTFDRLLVLTSEVSYWARGGELIATARSPQLRYVAEQGDVSRTAELQGRTAQRRPADFDPQEAGVRACASRRGKDPLYWEEIGVGELLPDLPMGRLGIADILRWNAGTRGPAHPDNTAHGTGRRVNYTGYHDPGAAVSEGIPDAFDNGPLRSAWITQLVTNWMGDWGEIVALDYTLRGFNVVGDTNTVKGAVKEKYVRDDHHYAVIEAQIENDLDRVTAQASVTVELPPGHTND